MVLTVMVCRYELGRVGRPPNVGGHGDAERGPERRARAGPDRTTATAGSSHTSQLAPQTHWNLSSLTRSWVGSVVGSASRAGRDRVGAVTIAWVAGVLAGRGRSLPRQPSAGL